MADIQNMTMTMPTGESAGGFTYSYSNFDEPIPWSNYRAVLMGLTISFSIVSWLAASGRLYTRFKVLKCAGIDDYCVIAYLITTTVGTISICLAVQHGGLGQHLLLLSTAQKVYYVKSFYAGNIVYNISATSIKLALLFQYRRIYRSGTTMSRLCVAAGVIVAAWGLLYVFMAAFPCFPVSDFWNKPPSARCFGYGSRHNVQFIATYISHTGVNVLIDVIVLVIPLPLLADKETGPAQRYRLIGLIFMGVVVIAFACWRLQSLIQHQAATYPTRDPTWYGPITILLANLEVDSAAICASVPIFWPVMTDTWVGRIFVTHEVCVTSEQRIVANKYGEEHQSILNKEDISRTGSQSETNTKRSLSSLSLRAEEARGKDLEAHYQDSYILEQVDPLRVPVESGHHAEATSNGHCTKDPNGAKVESHKAGGWLSLS